MHPIDPEPVAFLRAAGCVYAEEEARILTETAASPAELRGLLERRASGEPLEHVVGWAEFCGLRVRVREGVFVPRRRSEFLVEHTIEIVRSVEPGRTDTSDRITVLDLCCGTGAIGLAVATRVPGVTLLATDVSPAAVECACENLASVGGRVFCGDLLVPLPDAERHHIDVIVASPPYVPSGALDRLPAEARLYEPLSALDGGADGADLQRRIFAAAGAWLRDGGTILVETGRHMAHETAEAAHESGFDTDVLEDDDRDATVVIARRG